MFIISGLLRCINIFIVNAFVKTFYRMYEVSFVLSNACIAGV